MRCVYMVAKHCSSTLHDNHTSCGHPALSLWVVNQPKTEMYGLLAHMRAACSLPSAAPTHQLCWLGETRSSEAEGVVEQPAHGHRDQQHSSAM